MSANAMSAEERAAKIAVLNDLARKQPWNVNCKTLMTQGIASLTRNVIMDIRKAVEDVRDFPAGDDPYNEHDFGVIEMTLLQGGEISPLRVYWKIDYYEAGTDYLSPDPTDIHLTDRVLTLMLAEEY